MLAALLLLEALFMHPATVLLLLLLFMWLFVWLVGWHLPSQSMMLQTQVIIYEHNALGKVCYALCAVTAALSQITATLTHDTHTAEKLVPPLKKVNYFSVSLLTLPACPLSPSSFVFLSRRYFVWARKKRFSTPSCC